jgi:hypothetical protein
MRKEESTVGAHTRHTAHGRGNGQTIERFEDGVAQTITTTRTLTIKAPNYQTALFLLEGTAPYVQNAFSGTQRAQMRDKQVEGSAQAGKRRAKPPKDFDRLYREAQHRDARDDWYGIPAPAFRNALIDACRLVGFAMTRAKCALFVAADGRSADGTPLVKIIGEPHPHEMIARNETGVADIRIRPMWDTWRAELRIRFNADQFTELDVANLLLHAGISVGIGEGRPFSKNSAGLDWGTFTLPTLGGRSA